MSVDISTVHLFIVGHLIGACFYFMILLVSNHNLLSEGSNSWAPFVGCFVSSLWTWSRMTQLLFQFMSMCITASSPLQLSEINRAWDQGLKICFKYRKGKKYVSERLSTWDCRCTYSKVFLDTLWIESSPAYFIRYDD